MISPTRMLSLCWFLVLRLLAPTLAESEAVSEGDPRYLDRFDLKFGSDSLRLKNKRQSPEDLQVSSIIGSLLREQDSRQLIDEAEDRFSSELITNLGASAANLGRQTIHGTRNLGADVLTVMRDILRVDQAGQLDTEVLSDEDLRTLKLIRGLENSPQLRNPPERGPVTRPRKPIRFSEPEGPEETGLDLLLKQEQRLQDNVPNLRNRGRFSDRGRRLPKELGGSLLPELEESEREADDLRDLDFLESQQRPRGGRQSSRFPDRLGGRDRERERDRDDRDRDRDGNRDRDRHRDRDRDEDRERDRQDGRNDDRERDIDRDRERGRGSGRPRDRDSREDRQLRDRDRNRGRGDPPGDDVETFSGGTRGTARQRADDDEDCRDDGFERQTRQECQIVSYPDCHIEDKVKYRTEIVPQCKTRVATECLPTTVNVPKEECVQAFEQKCEEDYKIVERHSYKEECTEVIEEVCKEHVEIPVPVEVPYPQPVVPHAHHHDQIPLPSVHHFKPHHSPEELYPKPEAYGAHVPLGHTPKPVAYGPQPQPSTPKPHTYTTPKPLSYSTTFQPSDHSPTPVHSYPHRPAKPTPSPVYLPESHHSPPYPSKHHETPTYPAEPHQVPKLPEPPHLPPYNHPEPHYHHPEPHHHPPEPHYPHPPPEPHYPTPPKESHHYPQEPHHHSQESNYLPPNNPPPPSPTPAVHHHGTTEQSHQLGGSFLSPEHPKEDYYPTAPYNALHVVPPPTQPHLVLPHHTTQSSHHHQKHHSAGQHQEHSHHHTTAAPLHHTTTSHHQHSVHTTHHTAKPHHIVTTHHTTVAPHHHSQHHHTTTAHPPYDSTTPHYPLPPHHSLTTKAPESYPLPPIPLYEPNPEHPPHDAHHPLVDPNQAKLDNLQASIVEKFNSQFRGKREARRVRRDSEADGEADAEGRRAPRIGRQVLQSSKGVTSIKDLSVNELQGLLNSVNNGILLRDSHGSPPALGNHVLDLSLLSQHQHSQHDQSNRPALGMAFEPSPTLTPNGGFQPSAAAFHSSQSGLRDLGPFHNTLSVEPKSEDLSEEALLQDPMIQERLQTLRTQQLPEYAAEEAGTEGKGDQEGLMSDAELLALMSSPMVAANLDKVSSMEDLVALINAERTRQGSSAETSDEELMRGGKALQSDDSTAFQNVLSSNQNKFERQLLLPPSLNDAAPKPRLREGSRLQPGRAKTRIVNNLPSSVNFPETLGTSSLLGSLNGNPLQSSPTSRPFHNTLPFQPPLPSPHPTLSSFVGSFDGLGGSISGLGSSGGALGGPVKIPLGGSIGDHHNNPLGSLVAGSAERAEANRDDLVKKVIQHLKENQPLLSFPNSPTLGHPNPLLPSVHLDHHPPDHHPQPQLVDLPDHPPHSKPHPPLPPPTVTKTEVPAPYGCKAYSTKTCQKVPVVVPEKVPVPRCYDVPKVECFQVLTPVPDLECAPRAHEDCVDIVNEVPYLAPEEKCYDVATEECVDVTEDVPIRVCKKRDRSREPKARLVSAPYTERN